MNADTVLAIIAAITGNTIIIGAAAGLWRWWSQRSEQERIHRHQQSLDQQEHLQGTQSDALKAVLGVNERLVTNLIEMSNGRFRDLEAQIGKLEDVIRPSLRMLADLKAQMQAVNRDWARVDEIVADIDLVLHRIEAALKIGEYGETTQRGTGGD